MGIPLLGITLALVFSGVSFRFGATCHINHPNSLALLWIPLLVFAAATVVITFATFGYCVKVYLASLSDNSDSTTEGSGLPTYNKSLRVMSPRQAYRRVRRVVALQWRGIAIVLIIIADVIFFSIVFVFQDHIVLSVTRDPEVARTWIECLIGFAGDKNQCLDQAKSMVVNEATVSAVLLLLAVSTPPMLEPVLVDKLTGCAQLNGIWLLFLLGRWSMLSGWSELAHSIANHRKKEFVSVDARYEVKKGSRTYEMLSRDSSAVVSPLSPAKSPPPGRETPDYFERKAQDYQAPMRSCSSPQPPRQLSWDPHTASMRPTACEGDVNPLGMHRV